MTYKKIIVAFVIFSAGGLILNSRSSQAEIVSPDRKDTTSKKLPPITLLKDFHKINTPKIAEIKLTESKATKKQKVEVSANRKESTVFTVPFFSQFSDITPVSWQKIGCGIASLAMLIEFYEPSATTVDNLLDEGIDSGAYISSAGWSHAGLIDLANKYGLNGSSRDMSGLTMSAAFTELKDILKEGPVMVSVHYTFDPKNPIPHLVVINGITDDEVFYNDPAEKTGGGSITISKFQSSWKKRYIEIHASA